MERSVDKAEDENAQADTPTMPMIYQNGSAGDVRAPILLIQFDGAMDAGDAGALAVQQLLGTLSPQRVATFDSDALIDYRSHRPMMTIEDWVTTSLVVPQIALDLVHDDLGNPLLILHGPEPDARWETFTQTVISLARKSGVEISFTLHGIPSGVPHTRPTPVHMHATDASLLPDQPQMVGSMHFSAPFTAFLQERLSQQANIEGLTFLAAVPYYMSDGMYPRAASTLLSRLADFTNLSLPVGDLERGARDELEQINSVIADSDEVAQTIEALENHYDMLAESGDSTHTFRLMDRNPAEESLKRDINESIEGYLAARERIERERQRKTNVTDTGSDKNPDDKLINVRRGETVEDVLGRLARRRKARQDKNPDQSVRDPGADGLGADGTPSSGGDGVGSDDVIADDRGADGTPSSGGDDTAAV